MFAFLYRWRFSSFWSKQLGDVFIVKFIFYEFRTMQKKSNARKHFEEIQSITVLFSGRQIQSWACLWISIRRAERKYRNRDCRWKTWKCSLEVSAEPNLWGWVYGGPVNDAWSERGNTSIQRAKERPRDVKENIFATKYFKHFHIDSIFIVWNQNKSVCFES